MAIEPGVNIAQQMWGHLWIDLTKGNNFCSCHKITKEAPHGLPDYRIKMYPSGEDKILISFEPDPNVEHILLWCDQGQSPRCKLTPDNECQKTTLREGYSSKVFKDIKPCHNYTLQICPQGEDSITQMFQVFIPDLSFSSYQNPSDNKQVHVIDISSGLKSSSLQPTSTESESSNTYIIWIVVGSLTLSSFIVSFLLYRKFASGGSIKCPCKEMKRKILLHFDTFTSSDTCDIKMGRSIEEETRVLGSRDTPTVPIFYYPDNNSHSDKDILSNDDFEMFGVLFIINSKGLHQFLPCLKFQNKSSPKKQTVVRYLKERHNKVFILELCDDEKSDISDIQTLLDLDNVIQLNDGKADDSIKHILNLLKDQDLGNQTFSKKLEVQTSLDGGYYSGDKFPQPIKTFFPPELVSADSEGSINDRLAAINKRCSKYYCEEGVYEVDYLGATFTVHQAADSLSV
ncbi:hypothetical protein LOTGIDRAFT_158617 [Lottia gigantea]|uniref:Uncharacterized protein n=1 Tax=Lottia gigantea TaxID=225164 RepID=V4A6I0_LOTGI|nr:hypothetical protein LOTGIDRAFT_158617 [Lottia gigantea]ESO99528.1 hypothetical protein LOTGIDRAFT_158617 [Lottia gigantea]